MTKWSGKASSTTRSTHRSSVHCHSRSTRRAATSGMATKTAACNSPCGKGQGSDQMLHLCMRDYCLQRGFKEAARAICREAGVPAGCSFTATARNMGISVRDNEPAYASHGALYEAWSAFWDVFTTQNNDLTAFEHVASWRHSANANVSDSAQPSPNEAQRKECHAGSQNVRDSETAVAATVELLHSDLNVQRQRQRQRQRQAGKLATTQLAPITLLLPPQTAQQVSPPAAHPVFTRMEHQPGPRFPASQPEAPRQQQLHPPAPRSNGHTRKRKEDYSPDPSTIPYGSDESSNSDCQGSGKAHSSLACPLVAAPSVHAQPHLQPRMENEPEWDGSGIQESWQKQQSTEMSDLERLASPQVDAVFNQKAARQSPQQVVPTCLTLISDFQHPQTLHSQPQSHQYARLQSPPHTRPLDQHRSSRGPDPFHTLTQQQHREFQRQYHDRDPCTMNNEHDRSNQGHPFINDSQDQQNHQQSQHQDQTKHSGSAGPVVNNALALRNSRSLVAHCMQQLQMGDRNVGSLTTEEKAALLERIRRVQFAQLDPSHCLANVHVATLAATSEQVRVTSAASSSMPHGQLANAPAAAPPLSDRPARSHSGQDNTVAVIDASAPAELRGSTCKRQKIGRPCGKAPPALALAASTTSEQGKGSRRIKASASMTRRRRSLPALSPCNGSTATSTSASASVSTAGTSPTASVALVQASPAPCVAPTHRYASPQYLMPDDGFSSVQLSRNGGGCGGGGERARTEGCEGDDSRLVLPNAITHAMEFDGALSTNGIADSGTLDDTDASFAFTYGFDSLSDEADPMANLNATQLASGYNILLDRVWARSEATVFGRQGPCGFERGADSLGMISG
ncbi:hypothetical protein K437DRAFT_57151 [Tilletiaria anomala UBC 951]|uniref:Uncharacterized protein n=1 Tax=Tilletiaria anomala (strain ATCC 24038 / CBS 436.72 / UBC 951) TaxID=1037660 RepID=A0A066VC45_TILAU|nr:uncharacterized protein K437DRAFT_57151 [Tilletiaria anomala UBC 951]KDN36319.1 hypothetical protein K437DRAFT_57151 [Tilletiaria anomala UBC 951]